MARVIPLAFSCIWGLSREETGLIGGVGLTKRVSGDSPRFSKRGVSLDNSIDDREFGEEQKSVGGVD